MTTATQTTLAIYLTSEEAKAFRTVDRVLQQLQDTYTSQTSFESVSDGTMFKINELSRVRGVIDTIVKNTHFRIK